MDSPDASKNSASTASATASSPPIKDSPFSSYVSNLSPIHQVNASHGLPTYGDLNFPSPEPVFKSPHFVQPRKSDILKSSQSLALDAVAKFSLRQSADATTLSGDMLRCKSHGSVSTVKLTPSGHESEGEGNPSPEHETCGGSSTCVDAFLADTLEICDDDSVSPECSKQSAELPQNVHGSCTSTNENIIESNKNRSDHLQSVSPLASAFVDRFIADPSEHSDSPDLQSQQAVVLPQRLCSVCISTEEMNSEIHVSPMKNSFASEATEWLNSSSNAEKDLKRDEASFLVNLSLKDDKPKMADEGKESHKIALDEPLVPITTDNCMDTDLLMAPQVNQNKTDDVSLKLDDKGKNVSDEKPNNTSDFCCNSQGILQICAAGEQGVLHSSPQSLPELLQDVQVVSHDPDVSGEFILSADNQTPYDEDTAQLQRGMRKRLQFEAIENHKTDGECKKLIKNFICDITSEEPLEISLHMNTSDPSHVKPIEASGMKQGSQLISQGHLCKSVDRVDVSGQKKGDSSVTDPRPSGIGLHLNTVGSVGHNNCSMMVQALGKDSCMEEESFLGNSEQISQGSNSELVSPGLTGKISFTLTANSEKPMPDNTCDDTGDKHLQNDMMELTISSISHQTPLSTKPIECSMQPRLTDQYVTPCSLKRPLSVDDSKLNLSSQSSPRKKRKKASDNEGQKRCSCKRSKCLKLYCDCFAAGTFCSEVCGCQQCVNRPENEDTIHEARQQIESRNPLAFAPKVVLYVSNPPKDSEESTGTTPSSARHKRGCNCKKSLCLKKYCECYQAGVGCSFGCRCEGCKNTFGRKDGCADIIEIEHMKSKEQKLVRDPSAENSKEKLVTREVNLHLSPLTPSIQSSNGVDVPKSLLPITYYASPETSASAIQCYEGSPGSPMNMISKSTFEMAREDNMLLVPDDQEIDFDIKVDTFSPGWDGFPDICNFSPLPNPPPSNDGASVSFKTKEPKILQTRLFQGSSLVGTPLRWRSSPVTPLPQFGKSKILLEPDSDNGPNKSVGDDAPEVLEDPCSPIKAVTASSPKQKRVSPPKRLFQETRSSSSSGLRSGRKFILQSVPSFPPLTPYSKNSRGSGT
ncbi:unnamed protein product [Musa acuminata subsp. malaccensis]|nr:PREDICTED: uncharacterized protein LOC103975320 isoform X1 [Musa acuminata subsp. malaccensis]CAG1862468.1 unnamed protein product [Musa acuminata subsp. malaccensis]